MHMRTGALLYCTVGVKPLNSLSAGFCPDICGELPEKQRTAAGLAVSMVVLTSCEGDVDGAARAVASAAADGDLQAFGAGLSVGATALAGAGMMLALCISQARCMARPRQHACPRVQGACACSAGVSIAGPDESGRGQLAKIVFETLTTAASSNRTLGVASALGNALASMTGSPAEAMANETVTALNELAVEGGCAAATDAAAGVQMTLTDVNSSQPLHTDQMPQFPSSCCPA